MKNQKYSGIEYGDNNDELLSEMSIEYDKSEDVWVKPLVEKQEVFEKSSDSNCISYATEYVYDGATSQQPVEIHHISSDGMESLKGSIKYDPITQTKISETDCNENFIRYEYDSWQRPIKIFTAYDKEEPAVKYDYKCFQVDKDGYHNFWYTKTDNKVSFTDDNTKITTLVQIDGLGSVLRTAKNGVYYHTGEGRKELG